MAKTMLNYRKFRQNPHPVLAKMMAKLFRRGISGLVFPFTAILAEETWEAK
jgi:hypothetical protein